ncbi:MAG TPA: universal stress protein [Desulfitobacteriaceae bacterium]|nr:universal stress protein [Desulfitobacteriaceae bacterium]
MFTRIIIASETSPDAFYVLKQLKRLQKLGAKECLLLQCLQPHEIKATLSPHFNAILEENLNKQKEVLLEQGFKVQTRVVSGHIRKEVTRIAVEEDYSIIVAGAAEYSLIGEVLFGVVAHEIIHQASKPVLLIRIPYRPEEDLSTMPEIDITSHVLFPTDFSENAGLAFEYVKKMVTDGVNKITLIHVQDPSHINPRLAHRLEKYNVIDTKEEVAKEELLAAERLEKFNITDTQRLEDMKKELQNLGSAEIDIQLLCGSPSVEIMRVVNEQKIPLVVMGSQGRGFVKEVYLGSVSNNLTRHSSASILLIPIKR